MNVDTRSIAGELHDLDDEGMHASFAVIPGGRLRCSACHTVVRATETQMLEVRRLEGESDPSEMSAVVGMRCPHCQKSGSAVLGYGPMASAEDQDVLLALAIDDY